jgi:LysM repeat protein
MKVKLSKALVLLLLGVFPLLSMQACSSKGDDEDLDLAGDNYEDELANEEGNEYYDDDEYEDYAENVNEGENDLANWNNWDNNPEDAFASDDSMLDAAQTADDLEQIIASEEGVMDGTMVGQNMAQTQPQFVATAAGALPETGSKMPYVVKVGDTLSTIAQAIYGDSSKWQEMATLTSIENANLVKPGDVVYYQLNEQTAAFALAYEGTPKEEMVVQKGDTLSSIAQRVYGHFGDWKSIWRQNAHISNPDQLEVGQTISYLSPKAFSQMLDMAKSVTVASILEHSLQNSLAMN